MDLICSHLIFKVSHRINSEPLEASFGLQTSGRQSRQTEPTGTKPAVKSRIWGTLHGLFCLYNKGSIHCILLYSFVFDYLHSSTHLHTHTPQGSKALNVFHLHEAKCGSAGQRQREGLTEKLLGLSRSEPQIFCFLGEPKRTLDKLFEVHSEFSRLTTVLSCVMRHALNQLMRSAPLLALYVLAFFAELASRSKERSSLGSGCCLSKLQQVATAEFTL